MKHTFVHIHHVHMLLVPREALLKCFVPWRQVNPISINPNVAFNMINKNSQMRPFSMDIIL
jgi:hypothetical protein